VLEFSGCCCTVLFGDSIEEEENPPVAQLGTVNDGKARRECMRQIVLGQVTVEIVTAAQPLLKHGIGGWDPLQEQPAPRKAGAETDYMRERQLIAQDQMMHDSEQKDQVESAGEAVEQ
jgi:hypothetical protein